MTYLELVNATLRRLRRQTVSQVATNDYSTLIGDLVNVAKREVEDAWDWLELATELSITTSVGVATYTLTNFGSRYWIQQVHNTTDGGVIRSISQAKGRHWKDFGSSDNSTPEYWRINGKSGDDPIIEFWPAPSSALTVEVYAKVAQADLLSGAQTLTVPYSPVLAGAYLRALDERGEDGGTTSAIAQRNYVIALGDAIAQDNMNRANGTASDWNIEGPIVGRAML